jgi:hypothetical protein
MVIIKSSKFRTITVLEQLQFFLAKTTGKICKIVGNTKANFCMLLITIHPKNKCNDHIITVGNSLSGI